RDRTNDAVRVDANELRVRVVGEGANLGFTQQARIEYASRGGKINTDAIDNSAGVDTSDHEVNIKILLYDAISHSELSGISERNELLAAMTDDVARLVLRDNYEQTQAISLTEARGESLLDEQARFIRTLERAGKMDRALEGLPDDDAIADRHGSQRGLTRPEIAILLAYSKISLYQELLASDLPDDPLLIEDLLLYFPELLRERFRAAITRHRLRREIVATYVTNSMINRLRPTFVMYASEESGKPAADVARAFTIIREAFDLRSLWSDIEALDNALPAHVQIDMLNSVGAVLERAVTWLLRSGYERLQMDAYVSEFRPRIQTLAQRLDAILPQSLQNSLRQREAELTTQRVPDALAHRLARLDILSSALDIVRIARQEGSVEETASIYFGLGARFGLDRLRAAGSSLAVETPWEKAAVAAVVDDLFNYQSVLASRVITEGNGARGGEAVDRWLQARGRVVERIDQLMNDLKTAPAVDLAMLTVASRHLRALAES
ncbi:MAG TPA: NAD-glutamate dehydrogenase domain-containing protein, partial [Thermoanaerobaculia bacterium]|nr:NAD-glutamate dehydrogenase domain-containing protein [Thermoanaerobaculia bacterium]